MSKRQHLGVMCIGLVVNTSVKPSVDALIGAMKHLHANNVTRPLLFLASGGTRPENIKAFAENDIDGLLFCGVRKEIARDFFHIMPDHPPVVICSYAPLSEYERRVMGNGGEVVLDNEAIGEMAAEFFVDHGLKNFAFLGNNVFRERIAGEIRCETFRRKIADRLGDLATFSKYMVGVVDDNEDFWEIYTGNAEKWLRALPFPCGILVNGDREAFNLINLCTHTGIKIPEQVEILGVNNSYEFCEQASPTISSIIPGTDACAEAAVRMLMDLVENPDMPKEKRFVRVMAAKLFERGSTSSGRNYGNVVTKVREYVRLNACSGIKVPDVVRHVGISRRLLEKRVRESMDMSLLDMIQSMRLANVCRLLSMTDMTITEITMRSGYGLTSNLGNLFKRTYGMTMRKYRKIHRD